LKPLCRKWEKSSNEIEILHQVVWVGIASRVGIAKANKIENL
jgi:hypothetical protein